MKKNRGMIFGIAFLFVIVLVGSVVAQEISYCCERTDGGAWCQDVLDKETCDTANFRALPTSCEATYYCKMGTCINSQEGDCRPNVPRNLCEAGGGLWKEENVDEIPQCQVGCCILGDSATLATQTKCKQLSYVYGYDNDFRSDITDSLECIASVDTTAKGACVIEEDYQRDCIITTKAECLGEGGSQSFWDTLTSDLAGASKEVEFHQGMLCSAEELGTNCGPTNEKTCVEGKNELYYVDSCGNIANIYDSEWKSEGKTDYWEVIYEKDDSCGYGSDNVDDSSCGNCDYYLGSMCKNDNKCESLDCTYKGEDYKHGESWCEVQDVTQGIADDEDGVSEIALNNPGSRYHRMVCFNGEVTSEPCADFRNEVCKQDALDIGDGEVYRAANCVANSWRLCTGIYEEEECTDDTYNDCMWLEDAFNFSESGTIVNQKGICVPKYAPGFKTWSDSDTEDEEVDNGEQETSIATPDEICSVATTRCVVQYETGSLTDRDKFADWSWSTKAKACVSNCYCIPGYEHGDTDKDDDYEDTNPLYDNFEEWYEQAKIRCEVLGDCGVKENYMNKKGGNENYLIDSEFYKLDQDGDIKGDILNERNMEFEE